MRIALVIVILVICGSLFNSITSLPALFASSNPPKLNHEYYDTYLSISDKLDNTKELDLVSSAQRRQVYLHHPKFIRNTIDPRQLEGGTYFVVNRMQRDKRYISYLQLCHFKICNMGRKRSARYFHMIRKLDDNES